MKITELSKVFKCLKKDQICYLTSVIVVVFFRKIRTRETLAKITIKRGRSNAKII